MKLKFGFLAVCASLSLFCSCSRKGAWQLTWQDDFENGRMDKAMLGRFEALEKQVAELKEQNEALQAQLDEQEVFDKKALCNG